MSIFDTHDKPLDAKVRKTYPDAARFIETCWSLKQPGPQVSRDETVNFWIYPCRKAPDVSRAYAVLREIVDQVPGSIIYIEEACRKFTKKMNNVKLMRPFCDVLIQRIWSEDAKRRVILRELERACEQAINPTFGFGDDAAFGGGGGGGGGPSNAISNVVHAGRGSGGNG